MIKREDQLVIFQIKLPRLLHLSHRNPAELAATKPYQLYAPGRRQHVSDRQILCLLISAIYWHANTVLQVSPRMALGCCCSLAKDTLVTEQLGCSWAA